MDNYWEKFQAAYQSADESVKALVDSPTIPECVSAIVSVNQLDKTHHQLLVKLFVLSVFGAISNEELAEELRLAAVPNGQEVINTINACINRHNPTGDTTPLNPASNEVFTEAEASIPQAATQSVPEAPAPNDAPKPIPHIRTMASDMTASQDNDAPTYSSSQAALLNESRAPRPPQQ